MQLSIVLTRFRADFDEALGIPGDLIDVEGFLGDWKNPTHLVLIIEQSTVPDGFPKKTAWIVPAQDFIQSLTFGGALGLENVLPDEACALVWFSYTGSDQQLLGAVKASTSYVQRDG